MLIKGLLLSVMCFITSFVSQHHETYFTILKLTENAFVAIPKKHLLFNSNSLIVVGDEFISITDSHTSPLVAKEFLKQIKREVSSLPVKYVIITHGHDDHALGISGYKEVLGKTVTVIAHKSARDHLNEIAKRGEFLFDPFLRSGMQTLAKSSSQSEVKLADSINFWLTNVKTTAANLAYPDRYIDTDLTIGGGKNQIRVYARNGHSLGDLVVYYPEGKILITGDLCHGYEPLMLSGYNINDWKNTLRFLSTFDINFHVGGHGDYFVGKHQIKLWMDYFDEVTKIVDDAKANGWTVDQVIEKLKGNQITVRSLKQVMTQSFTHVGSNVHQFYEPPDPDSKAFDNLITHVMTLYQDQ